ncbi:MAG: cysteine synthase A [Clostridia bacterium]|nr:cysteine synthase A [Clostridia bacterium]
MSPVNGLSRLIGGTPLVVLHHIRERERLSANLLAKLEYFNPTGSSKDRAAMYMLDAAESSGQLTKNTVIIEPTSGNTGISLAAFAVPLGYRVILTMPDIMSPERRSLLKAYGAEIILTDGAKGMRGAVRKAEALLKEIPGSFMPAQFENPNNARAHYETTAPEIYQDTDGRFDSFIASVGTGGTLMGCGRYFKQKDASIDIIAVEPLQSPVLSGGAAGLHKIQGIGAGFIPAIWDRRICNEIIPVDQEEAIRYARILASAEGLFLGFSSGAALAAAIQWAKRPQNENKTAVVFFPDGGDRYLSTSLYAP